MRPDSELQHDVAAELGWDAEVDASRIGVQVRDGVAVLAGYVPTFLDRLRAERAAKRVRGVRRVANDIEVELPRGKTRPSDPELAAAVKEALRWHPHVPESRIGVVVQDGRVTLEGDVEQRFQKAAAEHAAVYQAGVRGVINNISVVPSVSPGADIHKNIEEAFRRSAAFDASNVRVSADGGTVTLTGRVSSWPERDQAEQAAWSAPGVREVQNRLMVE